MGEYTMEFYTSSLIKRPKRLGKETRKFVYDSLNHKYGLDTLKTPNVILDHIKDYENMSMIDQYDAIIYEIVTKAPIRICDGELISGAATLGDAMNHRVPGSYKKGPQYFSISHLTVDFFEVLEIGMDGIREKCQESLSKHEDPKKQRFLRNLFGADIC